MWAFGQNCFLHSEPEPPKFTGNPIRDRKGLQFLLQQSLLLIGQHDRCAHAQQRTLARALHTFAKVAATSLQCIMNALKVIYYWPHPPSHPSSIIALFIPWAAAPCSCDITRKQLISPYLQPTGHQKQHLVYSRNTLSIVLWHIM
jgi:hypothetical protein